MGGSLMGLSIKISEFLTFELRLIVFLEFFSYDETGE
jgi:hypothetical protein